MKYFCTNWKIYIIWKILNTLKYSAFFCLFYSVEFTIIVRVSRLYFKTLIITVNNACLTDKTNVKHETGNKTQQTHEREIFYIFYNLPTSGVSRRLQQNPLDTVSTLKQCYNLRSENAGGNLLFWFEHFEDQLRRATCCVEADSSGRANLFVITLSMWAVGAALVRILYTAFWSSERVT